MKKLVLLILMLILSSASQISTSKATLNNEDFLSKIETNQQLYAPNPKNIQLIDITFNPVIEGWAIEGVACAGCPSFYYKVFVSAIPHQAENSLYYYYYYFYFYSNSYYSDGTPASTYLNNVTFTLNGINVFTIPYIVLNTNEVSYVAWLRYVDQMAVVGYSVSQINVQ